VSGFPLFTITWCNKIAKICPMEIGCPFTSWLIVEKRSSSSYLGQNQKNDQQWLFCLFCAIYPSSMWWVTYVAYANYLLQYQKDDKSLTIQHLYILYSPVKAIFVVCIMLISHTGNVKWVLLFLFLASQSWQEEVWDILWWEEVER
jgi:hypothetical protein